MKIINVVPLSRGIFKETLSYFSSKDMPVGGIITVNVRKRTINAIVESTEDVADTKLKIRKTKIRTSSYQMKKIVGIAVKHFFLPAFIEATRETAHYFATTTGEILSALTPKIILDEAKKIKAVRKSNDVISPKNILTKKEIFVFQAEDRERLGTYKGLIREEFARGRSIFFCLPTIQDVETTVPFIEKGIEEFTFMLHSGLTKKDTVSTWKKITDEKHPVLIVATGSFFSIPRNDIGTIIIDKESSRGYKTFIRPFFDIRVFAEKFAKKVDARLILGDIFLRPETIWRANRNEFIELNPLKFRSLSTAQQDIVDMKNYKKDAVKKSFTIISDKLKDLIKKTRQNNENLFILTPRRGLSPITICSDCSELVQCEKCSTPMTLHKVNVGNVFLCHKCGGRKTAEIKCAGCGGWRLAPLGIAIEGVEGQLKKEFPDLKIFRIDGDSTTTHKKKNATASNFFISPGSVLLGTEMVIPYLHKEIDNIAIVGIDSLFAIPDFRIKEKIFNILLALRAKTLKNFLIQTRNSEEKLFQYITRGNLLNFYRDELNQRKKFGYPPFSILIKITYRGQKITADKEMKKLSEILKDYEPSVYPAFTPGNKGIYSVNALLKIEREKWVDEKLLQILHSLPPAFTVKVDPGDLL